MKPNLAKYVAAMAIASFALTGCSANVSPSPTASSPASPSNEPPNPYQQQEAETRKFAKTLLGMAQDYAEKKIEEAGFSHRVLWKDGKGPSFITMDYSPTRINLYIKEGIVDRVVTG